MNHPQVDAATGLPADQLKAIEGLYRAFNDGDTRVLADVLSVDWEDIPLAPHQAPGRDGIKPLVLEFRAAFPDIRIVIHQIIGFPGFAAVRAEMTGTHQGEWLGVPATGRPFSVPIHEFHTLADGHITQTRHLEDWFGWLAQVGAWPAT